MIKVKKKNKIKRKKVGNVRTTETTRKKGGNVSQVVNVYLTKGGGGRRKAPAQRPTFFQPQQQLFTANYDNTLLNQIQPIQDKFIKMFNTNNDLLNKLLTKQRTSDSSIQTDTLTNDKLFTKETQTAPEKIPVFRPADTQTEPISFNTTGTQSEPIVIPPIRTNVIETQTEEPLEFDISPPTPPPTPTEPTFSTTTDTQTEPMIFNTIGTQSNPILTKTKKIQTKPIVIPPIITNVIETQTEEPLEFDISPPTPPPTPTPEFETTGTQIETPLLAITEKEEGDLADLLNTSRPQPQRIAGEQETLKEVKKKLKKKLKIRLKESVKRDRPNVTSDFVEGGGVDINTPIEDLNEVVSNSMRIMNMDDVNLPAPTPTREPVGNNLLEVLRAEAKEKNVKMRRGALPKSAEKINEQIEYYTEALKKKND